MRNQHRATMDLRWTGQTRRLLDIGNWLAALSICVTVFWSHSSAAAPPRKSLPGHVPEICRRLVPKGELPAEKQLLLAIGLPLRDEAGLEEFLRHVYDPADSAFRHYLTP